jgi:hypothetical protein
MACPLQKFVTLPGRFRVERGPEVQESPGERPAPGVLNESTFDFRMGESEAKLPPAW